MQDEEAVTGQQFLVVVYRLREDKLEAVSLMRLAGKPNLALLANEGEIMLPCWSLCESAPLSR
jgi:hypothetical protein